ncbi:hypothetical protein RSOL_195880, partial [Rhizoctonia solani AG-3 Rhs1AP]
MMIAVQKRKDPGDHPLEEKGLLEDLKMMDHQDRHCLHQGTMALQARQAHQVLRDHHWVHQIITQEEIVLYQVEGMDHHLLLLPQEDREDSHISKDPLDRRDHLVHQEALDRKDYQDQQDKIMLNYESRILNTN